MLAQAGRVGSRDEVERRCGMYAHYQRSRHGDWCLPVGL